MFDPITLTADDIGKRIAFIGKPNGDVFEVFSGKVLEFANTDTKLIRVETSKNFVKYLENPSTRILSVRD